jgi:hypothetical protein
MVAVSIDLTAVIENILRTLPNTTTLAVTMGDAPIEKFWVNEFHHAFRPFEGRVKNRIQMCWTGERLPFTSTADQTPEAQNRMAAIVVSKAPDAHFCGG